MFIVAATNERNELHRSFGQKRLAAMTPNALNPNMVMAPLRPPVPQDHFNNNPQARERHEVTWSDHFGRDLEQVRYIPRREESNAGLDSRDGKRLIILLLSPTHRKYEFICCRYPQRTLETAADTEKMSVKDLLEQLPGMASHELLKRQTYTALCRRDNRELINAVSIQNYDLRNFEMLWAVPRHYCSKQLAPMVACVLSNKGLLKALRFSTRHWEVHTFKVSTKVPTTAILDKLKIKHKGQDDDGDGTCPSSDDDDDDDEAQLKRTFPLCPQPQPETMRVSPSLLSMFRHRSFAFASQPFPLASLFSNKDRNNSMAERRKFVVALFAGTRMFQRKWIKGAGESRSPNETLGGSAINSANGLFDEVQFAI